MDRIRIEGLEVRCVVGVYPRERDVPQRLLVDCDLFLDTERAATTERLAHTVDYDAMSRQIAFVLEHARFRMLETAAHVLARYLLAPPARGERRGTVERLALRLTKPEAMRNRATPSLSIERERAWAKYVVEQKPFGTVDVIAETADAGIYRLNVAPGSSIPLHVHRVMDEAEMVLTSGLHCQGQEVARGTVHRWPHEAAHVYDNPTERWQTILCVDSPSFVAADEIEVEGEPALVPPLSRGWT